MTMMMKILFISGCDIHDSTYGGGIGTATRYHIFRKFGKLKFMLIKKHSNLKSLQSVVQKHFPPVLNRTIKNILREVKAGNYDAVIFDSSIYGDIIKAIKINMPDTKIISLFQNTEFDYLDVRFGKRDSLKKRIYKILVKSAEYNTLKYGDTSIAYSKRDAQRIRELYHKATNEIIPLSMEDAYPGNDNGTDGKYCLLFGSMNTPNYEGFLWFVRNVSPRLNIPTVIAGKGYENYKDIFETGNVSDIGFVPNVEELYKNARVVAIPIFHGSGMKIKTVEALMYSKYVFATDEAWEGFCINTENVGGRCNTAKEFIEKINDFIAKECLSANLESRKIYLKKYSPEAVTQEYKRVIKRTICENKI